MPKYAGAQRIGISRRRKPVAIVLVALSIVLLLAACSSMGGAGAARPKLTVGLGVGLSSLDPAIDANAQALSLFFHVYDPLVQIGEDLKAKPALAESWKVVDNTTWELKLRKDVKWQNGDPFTARDVKFSIDRIKDPELKSRAAPFVVWVKGVDVVDDLTVRILTNEPYAPLDRRLTMVPIVPMKVVQQMGNEEFGKKPVGTGPFKVVEWVKDSHLKLEANPSYWGGAPKVTDLSFRVIAEEGSRLAALKAGEVDIVDNVPPERIAEIEGAGNLRVARTVGMTTMYGGMNTNEKPLDDVRVRRALNHAVNVDAIIKELLLGAATRSTQPLQPGLPGYNPDIKPYAYDPAKARQLLAEAGYPNGFEVNFEIYEGRYLKDKEVTQAIASDLAKVGVKANFQQVSYAQIIQKYTAKEVKGLFVQGALNPPVDPDHIFPLFLTSRGRGYYQNAETDPLVFQAATIMNPTEREAAYRAVIQKLVDDAPWIFLYNVEDIYGVNKRVTWEPRKDSKIIVSGATVK